MTPSFEAELPVSHHRSFRQLSLAACFLAAAMILTAAAGLFVAALPVGLVAMGVLVTMWRPSTRRARVSVSEDGLTAGDHRLARAEIREAFVVRAGGSQPSVLVRRRGVHRPILIGLESMEQGRELLRAIGLDAAQSVVAFRALPQAMASERSRLAVFGVPDPWPVLFAMASAFVGVCGVLSHASRSFLGVQAAITAAMIVYYAALRWRSSRVGVGADGIELRGRGSRRFVGYGEITSIERGEWSWGRALIVGLIVGLRDGDEVRIPMRSTARPDDGTTALLHERIYQAIESFQAGERGEAGLVGRDGRSVHAWVAALRSIGSGANMDMRTAPVPRERLFRIVEDSARPALDRAAAAVALSSDLDPEGRARLRIAAESTVAEKLRVVIGAASSEASEEEIEAALAEMEREIERREEV